MTLSWKNMVAILDTDGIRTLYDIHFDYDINGNLVTKAPHLRSKSDIC